MAQEHSDLHHPPVDHSVHGKLFVENGELEYRHPSEKAYFEEGQSTLR